MRWKLVVALAVAVTTPLAAQARRRATRPASEPRIDSMSLRAHTYFLTHDLLEGRGTGRRGNDIAALYLATAAEALGLKGAGDGGGYFQEVPLTEAVIDTSATRLAITEDSTPG